MKVKVAESHRIPPVPVAVARLPASIYRPNVQRIPGDGRVLIPVGTRITRDVEVSRRRGGTYRGTVVYEPSLGPAGQAGQGLPGQLGAPGTYLVGRLSIVVH